MPLSRNKINWIALPPIFPRSIRWRPVRQLLRDLAWELLLPSFAEPCGKGFAFCRGLRLKRLAPIVGLCDFDYHFNTIICFSTHRETLARRFFRSREVLSLPGNLA